MWLGEGRRLAWSEGSYAMKIGLDCHYGSVLGGGKRAGRELTRVGEQRLRGVRDENVCLCRPGLGWWLALGGAYNLRVFNIVINFRLLLFDKTENTERLLFPESDESFQP
jgi:hypothetical protein